MNLLIIDLFPDRPLATVYVELARRGFNVSVICAPTAVRYDDFVAGGLSVEKIDFRRRLDYRIIRHLRRRIVGEKIDIVHVFNKRALSNVMAATIGLSVRIAAYRGVMGNLPPWNPEVMLTYRSRRVRKIVCVCDAVKAYLLSTGIPESRLVRIYKGHDLGWYKKGDRSVLERFGIPSDAFVAVCVARMRPRKGVCTLLEAVARLRGEMAIRLLLIGEITDRRIIPAIDELGLNDIVHVAGFQKDAHIIAGACDVFVMPSLRREGLPRAVIEAMGQEVPAVVTDVGGMPEIVEDGKSGLIVPPADVAAMCGALKYIAADGGRASRMGRDAKERIGSVFGIEKTVCEMVRLYNDMD